MKITLKNSTLTFLKEKEWTKVYDSVITASGNIALSSTIVSGKQVYCILSKVDSSAISVTDPYFHVQLRGASDSQAANLIAGDVRGFVFPKTSSVITLDFDATRINFSQDSALNNKLNLQIFVR